MPRSMQPTILSKRNPFKLHVDATDQGVLPRDAAEAMRFFNRRQLGSQASCAGVQASSIRKECL